MTIYYNAALATTLVGLSSSGGDNLIRLCDTVIEFTGASGSPSGLSVTCGATTTSNQRIDINTITLDGISYVPSSSASGGVTRSYNVQNDMFEGGIQTANVTYPGITTGTYTVQDSDETVVIAPAYNNTVYVQLPDANLYPGRQLTFKNISGQMFTIVQVNPVSGQTIDALTSYPINMNHSVTIQANQVGATPSWFKINTY
jgi:hypothetical protein